VPPHPLERRRGEREIAVGRPVCAGKFRGLRLSLWGCIVRGGGEGRRHTPSPCVKTAPAGASAPLIDNPELPRTLQIRCRIINWSSLRGRTEHFEFSRAYGQCVRTVRAVRAARWGGSRWLPRVSLMVPSWFPHASLMLPSWPMARERASLMLPSCFPHGPWPASALPCRWIEVFDPSGCSTEDSERALPSWSPFGPHFKPGYISGFEMGTKWGP